MMFSTMLSSYEYFLDCSCLMLSFLWWLLLGGWLIYYLYCCCPDCSWMCLWCSNCLHFNETGMQVRSLLMSNILAKMFQIGCFPRWCYFWLTLSVLALRNGLQLILGCVVGLSVAPPCGE